LRISKKIALIVIIVGIAIASVSIVYFLIHQWGVEKFVEMDDILIDLDANGNASCQFISCVPPSKLADVLKRVASATGADNMERLYVESMRGSLARYGLEIKNPVCKVTGLDAEENFKIVMSWETDAFARWENNVWRINMEFVDKESAAQEIVAEQYSLWTSILSISENSQYEVFQRTTFVLPSDVENVACSLIGTWKTDYGGGSYEIDSVYLGWTEGRTTIIENDHALIATENEITLTPQQFLENYSAYTVTYNSAPPKDTSFASSVNLVRLDLKYGRELSESYLIYDGKSWYPLSPAQVLYYAADAIVTTSQGGQFSIQEPVKSVVPPDDESGDWASCWKDLSKDEYVAIARAVCEEIESTGKAPGTLGTTIGNLRFRDILFTFTRILSSYGGLEGLPEEVTLAPAPSGELTWDNNTVPANHTYFLLPDTLVITNTPMVYEVLENIPRPNYDNRKLAEEICNWTGTNITYGLSLAPPTSEEVLISRKGQCRDYTNVYLALSRTAGIPARRVSGWVITEWQPPAGWEFVVGTTPDGKTVASHAWIQVFVPGEGWVQVEPQSKKPDLYVGELPYEVYKQVEVKQTWMEALAAYETARGLI
jgi:transglutaminase-like putative cysteine protease